jgi:hypothetical protein
MGAWRKIAMPNIYDKKRRPVRVGDILKVFHFVGARRVKQYMYKQVIGVRTFSSSTNYFIISHLKLKPDSEVYHIPIDGSVFDDYEIVQSEDSFSDNFRDRETLEIAKGKSMSKITVKEIIIDFLKSQGCDGLCGEMCGCGIGDLALCDNTMLECKPAKKVVADCEHCDIKCDAQDDEKKFCYKEVEINPKALSKVFDEIYTEKLNTD